MLIKGIAQSLAEYMISLSNKYYQDRWIPHLEFELWREISEEPELLEEAEIRKLRQLHESSHGWILMDFRTEELGFMLTDQWAAHYKKHKPF